MDEYVASEVLRWYERLERKILEFAEHVPLTPQNEDIQSPSLATPLIEACSLLDSVFRNMTDKTVTVNGKKKSKDDCKIPDFAQLHSSPLDLPNTRSIMLVSPPSLRVPFEPWRNLTSGGSYIPLSWWQSSNDLKHDCLANLHKATLGATLDSLCALLQVLAKQFEMVRFLLRRGWFPTAEYTVDYILQDIGKGSLPSTFVVQTNLFAVPFRSRGAKPGEYQFPEDLKNLKLYDFKCKPELLEFLPQCL